MALAIKARPASTPMANNPGAFSKVTSLLRVNMTTMP
jgi:hypothetical protein